MAYPKWIVPVTYELSKSKYFITQQWQSVKKQWFRESNTTRLYLCYCPTPTRPAELQTNMRCLPWTAHKQWFWQGILIIVSFLKTKTSIHWAVQIMYAVDLGWTYFVWFYAGVMTTGRRQAFARKHVRHCWAFPAIFKTNILRFLFAFMDNIFTVYGHPHTFWTYKLTGSYLIKNRYQIRRNPNWCQVTQFLSNVEMDHLLVIHFRIKLLFLFPRKW